MRPETSPIISAAGMFTKPAAGVIPTRPATAPDANPKTVGLLLIDHSANIQAKAPMAADVLVTSYADAAIPSAARALPALNPNQPNHKRPAPKAVRATLEGNIASLL